MEVREILRAHGFRFDKSLGQNFITDGNLLNAIVSDAEIGRGDTVVEIGAGAGTLTRAIAERAGRVFAFEIDGRLEPILRESLAGCSNVKTVFADVLKLSDEEFRGIADGPFKVVANLPYYITTPLIMRFLESDLKAEELTLTMQREVAERLTARPGTPEYGAVTVAADAAGEGKITRIIGRNMFYPVPKVDSAVYRLKIDENRYKIDNMKLFKKTVKAAFLWRRKTLANNLKAMFSIPKEECEAILSEAGLTPLVRGETLSTEDFIALSGILAKRGL